MRVKFDAYLGNSHQPVDSPFTITIVILVMKIELSHSTPSIASRANRFQPHTYVSDITAATVPSIMLSER
jgi:hypothetical protein